MREQDRTPSYLWIRRCTTLVDVDDDFRSTSPNTSRLVEIASSVRLTVYRGAHRREEEDS
jgi:hypothetical protein